MSLKIAAGMNVRPRGPLFPQSESLTRSPAVSGELVPGELGALAGLLIRMPFQAEPPALDVTLILDGNNGVGNQQTVALKQGRANHAGQPAPLQSRWQVVGTSRGSEKRRLLSWSPWHCHAAFLHTLPATWSQQFALQWSKDHIPRRTRVSNLARHQRHSRGEWPEGETVS